MASEPLGGDGTAEKRPQVNERDGSQEPESSSFEQKLGRAQFLRLVGAGLGLWSVPRPSLV
jgi:hypothetical protein